MGVSWFRPAGLLLPALFFVALFARVFLCFFPKMKGGRHIIRQCNSDDFETIYSIINDGAQAYKGVIPPDRWKEPYMSQNELRQEIEQGIIFWGYEECGGLLGVMGLQNVKDMTLIRHAYIRTAERNKGIGEKLLSFLLKQTNCPVLIGTWADAYWAIRFYERRGFQLVSQEKKEQLLREYWSIPRRQIETSVVLTNSPLPAR